MVDAALLPRRDKRKKMLLTCVEHMLTGWSGAPLRVTRLQVFGPWEFQ